MKVLQLIPVISPTFGGPSVGSVELHKAFVGTESACTIISTDLRFDGASMTPQEVETLNVPGTRMKIFKSNRPRRLQNSFALAKFLFLHVSEFDLLHIHGNHKLPTLYGYIAARLRTVPYGLQPHGGYEPFERTRSRTKQYLYYRVFGRAMIRHSKYVLFASASEADGARDIVPAGKALVHGLGVATPEVREVPVADDYMFPHLSPDRFQNFLFLGRLARKKNPDVLIRAWAAAALSPNFRLVIAGPDGDHTAAELKRLATSLNIGQAVIIVGPVFDADKANLYKSCGHFVLPSDNENFGLVILEAMSNACNVITTKQVASSHVLRDAGVGQILPSSDQTLLADALVTAAQLGASVIPSTERAAAFSQEHCSWSALADAVLERAGS